MVNTWGPPAALTSDIPATTWVTPVHVPPECPAGPGAALSAPSGRRDMRRAALRGAPAAPPSDVGRQAPVAYQNGTRNVSSPLVIVTSPSAVAAPRALIVTVKVAVPFAGSARVVALRVS